MSRRKDITGPQQDIGQLIPQNPLISVLRDLLVYILASHDRKPSRPEAWEAMERLDKLRRDLESSEGIEPTNLPDPHKMLSRAEPEQETED